MANNYVDNIKKKVSGLFFPFDIHDKRFPETTGSSSTTTLLTVKTDGTVGNVDTNQEATSSNKVATMSDITSKINALDVSDTADGTKYVSAVSETDGKISVTRASFSPSVSITAGTGSAAPKVNISVAGNNGTAQPITTASTSVYGVTKLSSTVSNDNTTAVTPAAVADAISANTGDYISNNGQPFTSVQELNTYTAQHPGEITNNDYAIVTGTESGNVYYDRYKATVSGSTVTWSKEYRINNSSFSTAQWDAINSGITSSGVTKLSGIASGAEVNVQSNWNETNTSSDAYIQNKPTIPSVGNGTITIQKNGTSVNTFTTNQRGNTTVNITMDKSDVGLSNVSNVTTNNLNPTFSQASTRANIASGETLSTLFGKIMKWFADLKDLAFIAKDGASSTKFLRGDGTWQNVSVSQVQADWSQTTTTAADYIKNKPTTVSAFTNDANYIAIGGNGSVPTGGTTGQVLTKSSNSNYALTWSNVAAGGYIASTTLSTPVGTYNPQTYYGTFFIDKDGRVWYATTNTSASEWKLIKSVWT